MQVWGKERERFFKKGERDKTGHFLYKKVKKEEFFLRLELGGGGCGAFLHKKSEKRRGFFRGGLALFCKKVKKRRGFFCGRGSCSAFL